MRIMYCPLHYLDDDLLIETHRMFHRVENLYIDGCKTNEYVNFFYSLKERINWFYQLHERCVEEINFRFQHFKVNSHKTPPLLNMKLTYRTWIPSPEKYIENDIKYIIHRYRFKRKNIKYTRRPLPNFLVNIERDIDASCDNCIYFGENVKRRKCLQSVLRKPGGFCQNWTNGEIKYLYD